MSAYGSNTRQGNARGPNHSTPRLIRPPPPPPPLPSFGASQIACRICDRVFMSTQALITHIECHMLEEEASRVRQMTQQQCLRNLTFPPNPVFPPNSAFPPNPALTRPGSSTATFLLPTPPPTTFMHQPNQQFFTSNYSSPLMQPRPQSNPFPGVSVQPPYPQPRLPSIPTHNSGVVGLSSHFSTPSPHETERFMMEEGHSDGTKPFLSLLDNPILQTNGNGNKNSDPMLELALKL